MSKVFWTLFACSTLLALTSISTAGEERERQIARLLELMPQDTVSNAESFETNGFQVKSSRNKELNPDLAPSGNQFEALVIEADDTFKVGVEKGRPMSSGGGIGLYHRRSGAPMLTAADQNGDGRIDVLVHSVLSKSGEPIRDIIDYDADGQADLRIHFAEDYSEIWHMERWHRVENRDGVRGIVVEGRFKEIRSIDGQPTVQ